MQRRVGRYQREQSEEQTTQWSKGQNIHIKTTLQEVCKAVYKPHRDKQNKQRTSHYKRYAKPCMSPTGTNKTKDFTLQEVSKAVYEPHRDKQNKERTLH
jgi:hypothetical protein